MKSFRGAAALFLSLALVSTSGVASQAASPSKVEIQIGHEGGFVAPSFVKYRLPDTVVYNTGMSLSNDRVGFRSDVTYLSQRSLTKAERVAWAKKLFVLTKTPKHGWGVPGVADVPNTTIQLAVGNYQRKVSIYALSFTNGALSNEQIKARKNLTKALADFNKVLVSKRTTIFKPTRYEAWITGELVTGGVGLANPASVFCTSQGGELKIVDTEAGQQGVCNINGESVEEWSYFRAHAKDFIAWPEKLEAPKQECTAVAVSAVSPGLATPGETPQWLLPSGQVTMIYFRPVLPLEKACRR